MRHSDKRMCIVTEWMHKGSLWDIIHNPSVQLSWKHVVRICRDVAAGATHLRSTTVCAWNPLFAGLHAMHSMVPPLVHRDIKSPNLLVGVDDSVKIADFGLSRVQLLNATMTGQKGTWQWMAPEVLGSQRYAESADMYSYGVVVWELCCRDVPYRGMHRFRSQQVFLYVTPLPYLWCSLQAAVAVMNQTLTLDIPAFAPPVLVSIMCVHSFAFLHHFPHATVSQEKMLFNATNSATVCVAG